MNFQARWSYLPKDIHFGHRFVECVFKNPNGKFGIDFGKLSQIAPSDGSSSPQSARDLVHALGRGPLV